MFIMKHTLAELQVQISSPEGIDMDGIGIIPPGVRIGAPIQSIHFDPAFYPSPSQFDAFRFSSNGKSKLFNSEHDSSKRRDQNLAVNVSKEYIPWGYGKHACPGRWNAVQMMKLALAYIVTNYDVEQLSERPMNQPLLNVLLPPTKATIMIRRRT